MNLSSLYSLFRPYWKRLLSGMCLGAAGGLFAAAILPTYFRAEIVLAPATEISGGSGSLPALASQFGGLASIAGINLGSGTTSRKDIALETLRGQSFLVDFARRRELVVPMFAGRGWNFATGTWNINANRYDEIHAKWLTPMWGGRAEPSNSDIFKELTKRINVDEDRRSGVVRIIVESRSPVMAARWARQLVDDLNDHMRRADIAEARKTIEYLGQQVQSTQVAEMQAIFYKLIAEQTKSLMLAQVREEYALKVIDPPLVPDMRAWPLKTWSILLGTMAGFALAALSVLAPAALADTGT